MIARSHSRGGGNQIHAAAMDIEGLAQMLDRHCGAFDVPPGAACTPWTGPGRLAWLAAFPQGKIHRMPFALINIHACPGLKIFQLALREAPVRWIHVDLKVDVSVDGIGQPLFDQRVRDLDDLLDMLGGLRFLRCPHNSQLTHIFIVGIDVLARNRVTGDTLLVRPLNNLVVHVREVLHEVNLVTAVFQIPAKHVEDESAASMADVTIIVDGHAADIHPDTLRLNRFERLLSASERIEECQHGFLRPSLSGSSWPMRPNKIPRGNRETKADDDVELVKIVAQMFPLFSHLDPDVGE